MCFIVIKNNNFKFKSFLHILYHYDFYNIYFCKDDNMMYIVLYELDREFN